MAKGPPRFDQSAVEAAAARLLEALGLDRGRDPELEATPARIADLYREVLSGTLAPEPELAVIARPAGASTDGELVVVRDLPFYSLCVHHFVPFFGRADIAYLPQEKLLGIGGVPRLLEHGSRRPQLQERLGAGIADRLEAWLQPRGVAVRLEARHLCMEMRGPRAIGRVETRVVRGALAEPRWATLFPAPSGAPDPHGP